MRFRWDVADQAEVFALMKAAQVFVFPSLREGFGIAPLEALACGTRVVTTSHPDNQARHLVARSDRGYVTEPTVEALAACIEAGIGRCIARQQPARDLDRGVRLECGRRGIPRCSDFFDSERPSQASEQGSDSCQPEDPKERERERASEANSQGKSLSIRRYRS